MWNRNARPGRKNQPDDWNWFYEVLRNAFLPGYAARLPEAVTHSKEMTNTIEIGENDEEEHLLHSGSPNL